MNKAEYPINISELNLEGGNLNVASLDMDAEDEIIVEAEPVRPKRKLIATLKVSLREWNSFIPYIWASPTERY